MEYANRRHAVRKLVAAIAAGVLMSACSGSAPKAAEVKITSPANGVEVKVGESMNIKGSAVGEGIARIDVIVDGAVYATMEVKAEAASSTEFEIGDVPWTPMSAGSHTIVLQAFGAKPDETLLARSETLVISAKAAVVPPTPTVPPPPTVAPPTKAPDASAGAPAADAGAAANSDAPSLSVTNEFVNVRKGPGIGYEKIGELKLNDKAPVKGRTADNGWYQIAFQNGVGWVIADYVRANSSAKAVAVAAAPPLPAQPAQPVAPAPIAPAPVANTTLVPLNPVPAPVAPAPVAQQPLVGNRGVLRVNANPVASGSTVFASWAIQNFREGSFDKGDGRGFIGPIAGSMQVDVPGVTSQRTISLKWKDTSGAEFVDSITLVIAGQAVVATAVPVAQNCAEGSADWKGAGSEYKFCVKPGGDMEYVTPGIPNIYSVAVGTDKVLTVKWALYGVKGVYLMLEPTSQGCDKPGANNAVNNRPTSGETQESFNIKDLQAGGYKLGLRVVRQDDVNVRYNEKLICVTGGGGGGGGGGGDGGGGGPTPAP